MQDVDAVNVSGAELSLAELDDGELLALTRSGHQEAYAALFSRYSYAALRLARHLGQKEESDDVVSESFAQVLDLLNRGKGPDQAFRAYLFTTVRHECARRAKARQRVMPTDDVQQIDVPVEFGDGRLDDFERTAIRAAYESLPARWRTVLWHLDVEGRKPHELGPLLDLSPNSVSALVYRARSGLREAYLQQHVKDDAQAGSPTCLQHRAKLSAFVRRTASARDHEKVHAHLQSCQDCMAIYLDLKDVNRDVGSTSVTATVAASASGLAAVSAITAGFGTAMTNVAVLSKGVLAMLVPTAAAAALTTATLVVPDRLSVAEPSRTQVVAPATTVLPEQPRESAPAFRVAVAPAAPEAAPAARDVTVTATAPEAVPVRQPAAPVVQQPAPAPAPAVRTTAPAPKVPAAAAPSAPSVAIPDPAKIVPVVPEVLERLADPVRTLGSAAADLASQVTAGTATSAP